MNLVLQRSFPELATNCCENQLFAHVFNQEGQALCNVSGAWSFQDYVQASSNDFAIALAEDSQRTQSYSALIESVNLTLPDTPDGEYYEIEYLKVNTGSSPPYLRSNASLLATERFIWYQGSRLNTSASLGNAQRSIQDKYVAQVSIAYNSTTKGLQVTAWMEKNNVVVPDTTGASVLLVDSTGTLLVNSLYETPLPNYPGYFQWIIPTVTLAADQSYLTIVSVRDASNVFHPTSGATVVWD